MKIFQKILTVILSWAFVVALYLGPISQGFDSFTYSPLATYVPKGVMVAHFPGENLTGQTLDVTLKTKLLDDVGEISQTNESRGPEKNVGDSPGLAIVRFGFEITGSVPSLSFTDGLAESFKSCSSSSARIEQPVKSYDDLTPFEKDGMVTSLASAAGGGILEQPENEELRTIVSKAKGTEYVYIELRKDDPWTVIDYNYESPRHGLSFDAQGWALEIDCEFDASAFWSDSSLEKTLTFPSVHAFSESSVENVDPDVPEMQAVISISRQVEIEASTNWQLTSETELSVKAERGGEIYSDHLGTWDSKVNRIGVAGFSSIYTDRRAEVAQESSIFIAGIAGGLAASLVAMSFVQLIDLGFILNRRKREEGGE